MSGTVDLFVFLYLLIDFLVGLLASLALLGVRLGGAATKAAHDRGPGQRVRVYACRVVLMDRIRRVIRPAHMDHAHFYPASRSAFISRFRPAEFVVLGLRLYLQNETRKHFSRKEWMESRDLSLSPFCRITSTLNVLNHLSQTECSARVASTDADSEATRTH